MLNDMNLITSNQNLKLSLVIKIVYISFILFNILLCILKVKRYNTYVARIQQGDNYNMQVFVANDADEFITGNEIIIDNKKYNYEIVDIEKDYLIDNNDRFMLVDINVPMEQNEFDSNYISLKQDVSGDSIFDNIIKRIKKGMNL